MMHHKAIRTLGASSIGALSIGTKSIRRSSVGIIGGVFAVACAGADTPARDDELEAAIAQAYGNGVGVAGSGPAGGSGGRAPTGGAGGVVSRGGSTSNSGAGGAPGGAGGTPPMGMAGSSGGGECNGFAILQDKCSGPSCHGDGSMVSGFAASEDAALNFIDADPSGQACSGNDPIMDPGNPGNSLIIQKLEGTPCGSQMPFGPPLTGDEIQCIEDWIGTLE